MGGICNTMAQDPQEEKGGGNNANKNDKILKSCSNLFCDINTSKEENNMEGPKDIRGSCHWLIPNKILVGEFPYNDNYLKQLVNVAKINTFISMADLDDEPSHYGLIDYRKHKIFQSKENNDTKFEFFCFSIRDFGVSKDETLVDFVEKVTKHLTNDKNKDCISYIHCMTGHGRTGIMSVLTMETLYKMNANTALDYVARCHKFRSKYENIEPTFFFENCKNKKHPMPQEKSQFEQCRRLESTMHKLYDLIKENGKDNGKDDNKK